MKSAAKRARKDAAARSESTRASPDVQRVPVAKTYKLYIDGKFPRSESGRYYPLQDGARRLIANVCLGSRKDFRDAVVAARTALAGWSGSSAYLRGQILYRAAEMLEGRRAQFIEELALQGVPRAAGEKEVTLSIDRLVYYAGWADKYQQVFSSVNPVSTSHFNFSVLEPTGVVAILAPQTPGLLGLISNVAPAVAGGNTCVVLASESHPLSAVSFAEVLHASDFPAGVVNILTGQVAELAEQFGSHMDVNAVVYCGNDAAVARQLQEHGSQNIKRVFVRDENWIDADAQNPYLIVDTQETKTTWHPVGS
ncbi:MAG: aldehyde dehydrogenase family protein [Steroidobacteraceae bacterium]